MVGGHWGCYRSNYRLARHTAAFAWHVGSGPSSYELVYGSVSSLVALIFWIYLSSWITLFGAHLSVAIVEFIRVHRSLASSSGALKTDTPS